MVTPLSTSAPLVGTDTLDLLEDWKPGAFPTLGPAIERWALLNKLRILDGKDAGKLFKLTPSQRKFVYHWYRLREDGEFYYRGGGIRLARGSLKSPLAGWLATCELSGPVRFNGWDSTEKFGNGEILVGRRQSMPLI